MSSLLVSSYRSVEALSMVCLCSMISTSYSGCVPPLAQSGMVYILRRPTPSSRCYGRPMRGDQRSQRIAAEGNQSNVGMPAKPP